MQNLGVKVFGVSVYVNPNTGRAKLGKDHALPLSYLLGMVPKGDRRKIRKTLRRNGLTGLAGVPTTPAD